MSRKALVQWAWLGFLFQESLEQGRGTAAQCRLRHRLRLNQHEATEFQKVLEEFNAVHVVITNIHDQGFVRLQAKRTGYSKTAGQKTH